MRIAVQVLIALAVANVSALAQLEAVRGQAVAQLRNAADFICLELVDRARWSAGDSAQDEPDFEDALRLEVGWVDGVEVFGWPDSKSFEGRPVAELLGDGAFSTGDFLSHARALFVSRQGEPVYRGEEALGAAPALRFDYEVSQLPTGYRVSTGSGSAEVLYRGSFWADPDSLVIRRMIVEADQIPAAVGIESIVTMIDYRTVALRAGEALLPRTAEIRTRYAGGAALRNVTRFDDCRAFETSSSISFDAPRDEDETRTAGARERGIPAGERLFLRLLTPIEWGASRVGDLLEAELLRPVRAASLKKGSPMGLRIRRLQRRAEPEPLFVVSLSLEDGLAELESFAASGADVVLAGGRTGARREGEIEEGRRWDPAGVSTVYVFGSSLRLVDVQMRWRTRAEGGGRQTLSGQPEQE